MAGSTTEDIKSKIDIVDFLRSYLTLNPAGKNFKALCPFHKEKTASFMVSPDRQSWHCFGCGTGGDIFAFLMKHDNLEFGDALRVLAERAGVELKRLNPAEYKFVGLLYEINEKARDFFERQLVGSAVAKKYLEERGLKNETIEEFEIGWAPNESDGLTMFLLKSGYAPDDILRAGLSVKTERGSQFDRFRGRIMFPIHNHLGKVIGFTGRVLPQFDTGEMGKYVNSPETPIFNKSKVLYGFWKTKNPIHETGSAFLVEGQMDFLMSWQAGVKNVVASSGTALTSDHLRALRRLCEQLVVSFDNDEAGLEAAERAIDLAEASDFKVNVASFGDYKDPADAAKADPAQFIKSVADAKPAPQFYFERYLPPAKTDHPGRPDRPGAGGSREFLKSVRSVLGKLKAIASPIDRSFWLKELSKRVHIDEKVLAEEAEKIDVKTITVSAEEEETSPKKIFSRRELLSQKILAAAVSKKDFGIVKDYEHCLTKGSIPVLASLKEGKHKDSDPEIDERLGLILLQADDVNDEEIQLIKSNLLKEYSADHRRELAELVKRAEVSGDDKALESALKEFNTLPMV